MSGPAATLEFSVIVASRRRGRSLTRTLRAIRQLDHPAFEVIVVGDAEADVAVQHVGPDWVRFVGFDEPNLSIARNLGIAAAAGQVCVFIDDDAVPEPTWLTHHEVALNGCNAAASVGFVRGPNGVRFQSQAAAIDREAETHALISAGEAPYLPALPSHQTVKLVGTNMAVRREAFSVIGGFDPLYRYFLEDGDLSLRLAQARQRVAVAPLAEVHHALAASELRTSRRAPKTLFEIGRSTAIFLRRHPGADVDEIRARVQNRERKRLLGAMVRGAVEPRDVARLLATLDDGWLDGLASDLPHVPVIEAVSKEFQRVPSLGTGHTVLTSRLVGRRSALARARGTAQPVASRTSLFSYSLTNWPHKVCYTEQGVWLHSGGQFYNPRRSLGRFRWCRFARCIDEEIARVAKRRGFNDAKDLLSARAGYL